MNGPYRGDIETANLPRLEGAPVAQWLFGASAIAAVATILVLGRSLTFQGDEWAFIDSRSLADPATWFVPHTAHWVTVPVIVYRSLVETVGLSSYLPYLLVLAVVHVVVAAAVFALVRREIGDWPALAAGLVVMFLGRGFENLFWAFQMGFVGGIAAGLWGFALFRWAENPARAPRERRRFRRVGVVVLTIAVASTLTGAILLAATWLEALARPAARRERATYLAIPTAALIGWWIAFRPPVDHFGSGLQTDPVLIGQFVVVGLLESLGAVAGWGPVAGFVILVSAAIRIASQPPGERLPVASLGPAVALVGLFVMVALTRGVLGPDAAGSARYVYFGAVLAIVGLAPLLRGVRLPIGAQRWRIQIALVVLVEIVLAGNLRWLGPGRDQLAAEADVVRATYQLLQDPTSGAATSTWRHDTWTPTPPRLRQLGIEYGEPASAASHWWGPQPVPPITLEAVRQAISSP
jgi:hypothetical protein